MTQSNTFGKALTLTTFGESHGPSIGGIIDGFPPNVAIDLDFLQAEMQRRKPGQSRITTQRKEDDQVEVLSGVFEGKSTGQPIGLLIHNKDQRSRDYSAIKETYRPSHADFTYQQKYGIRDYRGGGRSSARETAVRVAAGAFAKMMLKQAGIDIKAFVSGVGTIDTTATEMAYDKIEETIVRCPDLEVAEQMIAEIDRARKQGDSLGGRVTCHVLNCPIGLGAPIFDRLEADLAKAMMSLPATKGFEIGSGFKGSRLQGSEHNDPFYMDGESVRTSTNNSGGVQGGISNGELIYFTVAFKPTATISKEQNTVTQNAETITMAAKGRHDPCVVPRAVPIVEAMAALVLADHFLRNTSLQVFKA